MKQQTHGAYVKIHNIDTPVEERERLRAYQREICARCSSLPGGEGDHRLSKRGLVKKVVEKVSHYAIIGGDRTANPSGASHGEGTHRQAVDEALRATCPGNQLCHNTVGSMGTYPATIVEISEADVAQLIARFREKWGAQQAEAN